MNLEGKYDRNHQGPHPAPWRALPGGAQKRVVVRKRERQCLK